MKHSNTWFASILIASALLLSGGSGANAQSPNPRNVQNQVGQAQPNETNTQKQKSEPSITPAANIPAASHQEVSPQKDQHQADGYLKEAGRWIVSIWTVEYTIAAATIVYSFFAILQWFALKKTVDETQGLLVTANRQAIAAQESAEAAKQQTETLTATLIATQQTADAATKSADTGEKARVGAERPHLIVQDFKMEGFKERMEEEKKSLAALPEIQKLTMPRTLRVTFTIKNYGKSPAFLTQTLIRFAMVNQIPIPFNYGPLPKPARGWILPPSEDRIGERFLEGGQLTEQNRMLVVEGKKHLVVFGFVRYDAISSKGHFFGFACRYVVGGGSDPGDRFLPIGDDNFWRYS
jgi:hypothetical protein